MVKRYSLPSTGAEPAGSSCSIVTGCSSLGADRRTKSFDRLAAVAHSNRMVHCRFAMIKPAHPERSAYPNRTKAAIVLVFFIALASARAMLVSVPLTGLDVTDFERRLGALREALP